MARIYHVTVTVELDCDQEEMLGIVDDIVAACSEFGDVINHEVEAA